MHDRKKSARKKEKEKRRFRGMLGFETFRNLTIDLSVSCYVGAASAALTEEMAKSTRWKNKERKNYTGSLGSGKRNHDILGICAVVYIIRRPTVLKRYR